MLPISQPKTWADFRHIRCPFRNGERCRHIDKKTEPCSTEKTCPIYIVWEKVRPKTETEIQQLVGKKFPAKRILSKSNYFCFADKIDGIPMLCTADLNLNRIRVVVEKGIITEVRGIG